MKTLLMFVLNSPRPIAYRQIEDFAKCFLTFSQHSDSNKIEDQREVKKRVVETQTDVYNSPHKSIKSVRNIHGL